ncbi:hypothetical protein JW979_08945 [bacterium]|nr:hypothetical protein [candidate division CSSED10-310 bacterium]
MKQQAKCVNINIVSNQAMGAGFSGLCQEDLRGCPEWILVELAEAIDGESDYSRFERITDPYVCKYVCSHHLRTT